MCLRDILKLAVLNISRKKMRNLLNVVAITIGVSSVLLISSIGTSGEKIIGEELERLGIQGIAVFQNETPNSVPLYAEDAERLKNRFTCIKETLPVVLETGYLKFNKVSSNAVLFGVGESAEDIYNVSVLYGRTPNKEDIKNREKVIVVDDELAEKAYRRKNVVGKTLTIKYREKSEVYKVIGVIRSQKSGINQLMGNSLPNFVYLPYSALNELRNEKSLNQIAVSCFGGYKSDGREFSKYLSKIKSSPGAYSSKDFSAEIDEIKKIPQIVSGILGTIAAISLIVAGIGIMNTMLSFVAERKKEIGIMIALGASKKHILFCFLCEAIIVVLSGGVLGAALSFAILKLVSGLFEFSIDLEYDIFFTTEMLSLACGIIFSILPAVQVSKMNPIVALGRN